MNEKEIGLIIGSETSKIGIVAKQACDHIFRMLATSKNPSGDKYYLDLANTLSISDCIEDIQKDISGKKLKIVFLNSGIPVNENKVYDHGKMMKKLQEGDEKLSVHRNNYQMIKELLNRDLINQDTKVVYNASIQVLQEKKGTENYSLIKKETTAALQQLKDKINLTILCISLVDGTNMAKKYIKDMGVTPQDLLEMFPNGQPNLQDIDSVVTQIIANKEMTRNQYVIIDGGSLRENYSNLPKNSLAYDRTNRQLKSISS